MEHKIDKMTKLLPRLSSIPPIVLGMGLADGPRVSSVHHGFSHYPPLPNNSVNNYCYLSRFVPCRDTFWKESPRIEKDEDACFGETGCRLDGDCRRRTKEVGSNREWETSYIQIPDH